MNAEPAIDPLLRLTELQIVGRHGVELDPATVFGNNVVGFGQMSEQVHPFLMIRSALLNHAVTTGQSIFAVTSAASGNGKTHIAANLAATLSRIRPTVLIELDLHKPSIGTRLGLPRDFPGIDDYLDGDCDWENTAIRIDGFALTIHRARRHRMNVEGLLATPALEQAMHHVRSRGDNPICIVDTPPALVCDDMVFISPHVDGVLLVVEEARSCKRSLRDVMNFIEPTPIIGTVLNRSISQPVHQPRYDYYNDGERSDTRRQLRLPLP